MSCVTITTKSGITYDDNAIGALLDRIPEIDGIRQIPAYTFHFAGHGDYSPDGKVDNVILSNEELAAIELWSFCNQPPEKMFAYVKKSDKTNVYYRRMPNGRGGPFDYLITNFTGESFGEAHLGYEYKSPAFWQPSIRQSVTLHAINGYWYYGTFYKSSGDYCRLKRGKRWISDNRPD